MFCPNCGIEIKNDAKFCYNCGEKLEKSDKSFEQEEGKVSTTQQSPLYQAYKKQIINKVVTNYCDNEEIQVSELYKKALSYDMSNIQVDSICAETYENIHKLEQYIENVYTETLTLDLSDSEEDDICQYAEILGFDEDDSDAILEKYDTDHQIEEKSEILNEVLNTYSETGKIDVLTQEDETIQVLLEKLSGNLLKIEQILHEIYGDSLELEEIQRKKVYSLAEKIGFWEEDMDNIVSGYEKKMGLDEKRRLAQIRERQELVYNAVRQKFPEKQYKLLGKDILFPSEYFVVNYISEKIEGLSGGTERKLKEIKSYSENAVVDIANLLEESITQCVDVVKEIENTLNFESQRARERVNGFAQVMLEELVIVKDEFESIDSGVSVDEAYRRARKDARGRWTGGGFGVGGALKGAATAGVMNMGTGAVHSVVNGIGNFKSSMKASGQKRDILSDYKMDFKDNYKKTLEIISSAFKTELKNNYPEIYWEADKSKENSCRRNMSSATDKSGVAAELLLANPYEIQNYVLILELNENVSYSNLSEIARGFHLNLREALKEYLDNILLKGYIDIKTACIVERIKNIVYVREDKEYEKQFYATFLQKAEKMGENQLDKTLVYLSELVKKSPKIKEYLTIYIDDKLKTIQKLIDKSKREDVVKEISMLWKERGFASGEQLALILSLGVKYSNNIVVLKEYIMEAVKSDDAKISQVDYQEPLFENIISAIEEYNTDQYCDIVGYLKNIDKAFPEKNIAQYFQMCIKKRIKDIEKGLKELEAQSDWTSSILAPQECWTDMDSKMEEAVDKIRRMSAEKYFAPIEEKAIIKKLEEKYAELSEKYVEAAVRDILNKAVIGEDKSIGKAIDEAESLRKKFSLESDRNNSNTYIPKVISAFFEDKITNAEEMAELCKIEGYIQESSKIIESVFGGTEKTLQEAQANLEQKKRSVFDYTTNYKKGMAKRSNISTKKQGVEYETVEEAFEIRRKVEEIKRIYDNCDLESEESVKKAITLIEKIVSETTYGKAILAELKVRYECLELKARTVLGTVYTTREEADKERLKVVDNVKFDSVEAANKERERIKKEKELEAFELSNIQLIKERNYSNITILEKIKRSSCTTNAAKREEALYEAKVMERYSSLKNQSLGTEMAKLQSKRMLFVVIGIIAAVLGIGPILSMGWIWKIIIVCVVVWPWGVVFEVNDDISSVRIRVRELKEIEKTFNIKGNKIDLKK